jgi:hypothetical protein
MELSDGLETRGGARRRFLKAVADSTFATGMNTQAAETGGNVFGPRPGYSTQIGILVSEMIWMREAVLRTVEGMTQDQLDFLLDSKANRVGALLLHLAATEKLYQLNTFDNVPVQQLEKSSSFEDWRVPMELGESARRAIKGHDLDYYLSRIHEVREKTLAEFRKRDDAWLMAVDKAWGWGPTNNLCKWFHVCEHESHHAGQVALLKIRAPGAKSESSG